MMMDVARCFPLERDDGPASDFEVESESESELRFIMLRASGESGSRFSFLRGRGGMVFSFFLWSTSSKLSLFSFFRLPFKLKDGNAPRYTT
jgi:hypothetical protein